MKILLDECVTKHLRPHRPNHEVYTVRQMEWSGIKNGKLMTHCVENGFDILLTIDKNLQYQQHLEKYPVTVVVLNSFSSKVEDLAQFIPSFDAQVSGFERYRAYLIDR